MGIDPLAGFARVWVDRWLSHGGYIIVDEGCDNAQIGMSLDGPERVAGRSDWQQQWHEGWHVGRWRELEDLLRAVPGAREAVIHHVALNGAKQPWGSTHMSRRAA